MRAQGVVKHRKPIKQKKIKPQSKKSSPQLKIAANDFRALKCLYSTGVATKSQLQDLVTPERLAVFEKKGYVSLQQDIVRLDKRGISYLRKEHSLKHRYISTSNHLKHDLQLTAMYLKLPSSLQETWKTEMELYYMAKSQAGFESFKREIEANLGAFKAVPDGAYIDPGTGEYIALEYVTENYTKATISQKQAFAARYLGGIKFVGRMPK
jgi:hypothetical protein